MGAYADSDFLTRNSGGGECGTSARRFVFRCYYSRDMVLETEAFPTW